MKEKRDITPEQIMMWSQELKIRSLEAVAKSVEVRLISQDLVARER